MTTTQTPAKPVDQAVAAALAGSAAASTVVPDDGGGPASRAWRWVVTTEELSLYSIASQGTAAEDQWRETYLGAGGALHRARVALAADGLGVEVALFPEAGRSRTGEPAPLARLVTTGPIEVTHDAVALYEATEPDPRFAEATLDDPTLDDPTLGEATTPRVPEPRASGRAARALLRELVGAARAEGVRLRIEIRRSGSEPGEIVGVLHGPDTREAWLRAGAALSAVRLTAARRGFPATVTPEAVAAAQLATARSGATARVTWPGRRRIGDRDGWLSVGLGTPYARVRISTADAASAAG